MSVMTCKTCGEYTDTDEPEGLIWSHYNMMCCKCSEYYLELVDKYGPQIELPEEFKKPLLDEYRINYT